MESATLTVGRDARRWTRTQLASIPTPERTKTWVPVPHYALVSALVDELTGRGITVAGEDYCTKGKGNELLIGVLDLRMPHFDRSEYTFAAAIKAGNDMKHQVRLWGAARVSACSNLNIAASGDSVCLARKHTSGLNLAELMPNSVNLFLEKIRKFDTDLQALHGIELPDERVKALLYDAFYKKRVAKPYLMGEVGRLYFHDEEQRAMFPERTAWSLGNAFTQAFKALKAAPAFEAGQRLGRFLDVLVNGERIPAQLELPMPEHDQAQVEVDQPEVEEVTHAEPQAGEHWTEWLD